MQDERSTKREQITSSLTANITMREKIEPKPMVRKRPKYESDRNAPKTGAKFVAAVQRKIMFVPLATPIL